MQVTNRNRFQVVKEDIASYFENNHAHAYGYEDIAKILNANRKHWHMTLNISTGEFIDLLLKNTKMKRYSLDFPARTINRLTWGDVSIYELVLSLEKKAFFSHYTALFIHGLTNQIPKKLYITHEQPKKNIKEATLLQSDISNAFSKAQRVSNNIARYKDYNICLLNGAFTNRLGVSEVEYAMINVMVTGIERTLIDATVRPAYSGGIHEVLTAFAKASEMVSINKLVAMLKKLNYKYPYHQTIGFYMQKTGNYSKVRMQLLNQLKFKYDFYLTHQMEDPDYSEEWKLYYPKGF